MAPTQATQRTPIVLLSSTNESTRSKNLILIYRVNLEEVLEEGSNALENTSRRQLLLYLALNLFCAATINWLLSRLRTNGNL